MAQEIGLLPLKGVAQIAFTTSGLAPIRASCKHLRNRPVVWSSVSLTLK